MADIAPIKKKPHWQLTPHPERSCWRKKYNGKAYYVGKGTERYSEVEYKKAWDEWQTILEKLEGTQAALRNEARRLAADDAAEHSTDLAAGFDEIERQERQEKEKEVESARTIGALVEKFLAHKKAQAQTGQKSVGRYANLQTSLQNFRAFVGADKPASALNALTLNNYYTKQLKEIADDDISEYSGRDRLAVAKQFINWAWQQGAIDNLPRNLRSKEMTISVTVEDVTPIPVPALQARIRAATGRLQVELLLMANCGFTQIDCSDLRHTEMDWKAGTITRKRSKMQKGKESSLPTVTFYLWPSTLERLREFATSDSRFVLTTMQGLQTVRDSFNAEGKVVRTDATAQAYNKMEKALIALMNQEILPKLSKTELKDKITTGEIEETSKGKFSFRHWSLKYIRKAGATAMGNSATYSRFAQYFLGQAAESVAELYYIKPNQEDFKAACMWLGEYLGIDTLDKIKPQ